jgi:uncharacterized protein YjbJ (UPF0337 family)
MAASDYAQERLLKFSLAWSGASTDGSGFVVCEPGGGRQGVLGGVQDQVPIIFLARMNVAKGYRNILFAHAQKSANANDQGADITGLVDKNVIDVADLIVGGIIDILLVKVGHGGPGGQSGEDLGGPRGHRRRLLRQGRYTDPHSEYGCCGCRGRRGHARCGTASQPYLSAGDPSFDPDQRNRSGTRAVSAAEHMTPIGDAVMDKDRIAGSARTIKGSVKETIGKVTGDTKLEAEGKADKVEGKVQNAIGGLKDALKGK